MTDPAPSHLVKLMTWLSPSYPVGAYSYSHGLEWAVEAGDVTSADALQEWLATLLKHGGGWSDAVVFAHVWRSIDAGDDTALADLADLSAALQPSAERLLETTAQGGAFLKATRAAWPCTALEKGVFGSDPVPIAGPLPRDSSVGAIAGPLPRPNHPKGTLHGWLGRGSGPASGPQRERDMVGRGSGQATAQDKEKPQITYPVAVATAAAGHDIPLEAALPAYLHAFAANLVSAGVRLVPLGQTDGQAVTAALAPLIEAIADRAMSATLDDLGGAAFAADIASMKHETQYTRLFRS